MENAEKKSGSDLSFLEHSMAGSDQSVSETNADIWGSFLSSLAGFDPTGIYESLFEKIYDAYQVTRFHSDRYPSLEERKKCIQNMRLRVEELILVFELGLILNIESEFTLAENCYRHLLQFYMGPEIYNNLGITQTYQAMSQYGMGLDQYYYPFELDINSKLYDLTKSRGERTAEDIFLRNKLLEQALYNFYQALDRDQHYLPAYSNIVSCLNLMNRPQQAIHFFDSLRLEKLWKVDSKEEMDKLSLAIGISYALAGREECKSYFKSCMNSRDIRTREFSRSNLGVYLNPNNNRVAARCPIKDEFAYRSPSPYRKKDPDRTYLLGKNGTIQLEYYKDLDSRRLKLSALAASGLELTRTRPSARQRNNLAHLMNSYRDHPELSFIPGKEFHFLKCRSEETLYILNKKGTILERILINKI
jgi:tetratricopeptide (TPR) repeat protein